MCEKPLLPIAIPSFLSVESFSSNFFKNAELVGAASKVTVRKLEVVLVGTEEKFI